MKNILITITTALVLISFSVPSFVGIAGAETRTLTDMNGRKVTVPEQIRSVVPLGGALRFLIYMQSLDLVKGMERIEQDRLVAGRLYGLATVDLAQKLPVIGEGGAGGRLPNFERIIEIWPDVIIGMGMDSSQVENIQQKTGIPVYALNYGEPGILDVQSVRTALTHLGKLLGRSDRSTQLITAIDQFQADLARRTAGIPESEQQTAYIGAISYRGAQGIVSTEAAYAPLVWAGGKNVAAAINRPGHIFIDPEQVLAWNPEVMFLDAGGLETVEQDYAKNPAFYQELKAAQKQQVYLVMPYNLYHTNIEIAYADAYFIGKTLYPERFQDIEPASKADEIFQAFIGMKGYKALEKEYGGFKQMTLGDRETASGE
ncbi:MAG: iron ABC transporter substrate-binding protein [Candidatus Electrothrix sp. GW3-4]|uniref:iron ABC transporter substrate-binding protein n=1 Tax=Candidatus Electrothrix sp. GW3-4 TaxID=3126740 RepID=UPI0030CCF69E